MNEPIDTHLLELSLESGLQLSVRGFSVTEHASRLFHVRVFASSSDPSLDLERIIGRGAGLRTVRIGPLGVDHLSSVHRPDYEARDLLDAANHILVEELA